MRVEPLELSEIESRGGAGDLAEIEARGQLVEAAVGLDGLRRADERGVAHDRHRLQSRLTQGPDRQMTEPLRKRLALRIDEQAMVGKARWRRPERLEQLDLDPRVCHVILAADHMSDTEIDVVDHAGERV